MSNSATGLCGLFTSKQLLLGLFILALALLDPFGLTSATDTASAQLLNRVLSVDYPRQGQQRIAVILIDDAYLLRHNSHWPLPYNEQSKLFKRLLAYRPQAVFVDLLYSHDHSRGPAEQGSALLANVFERYQRQGIPLLLANTGLARGEQGQVNNLPTLAAVSLPTLVSWSGQKDNYPLAQQTASGWMETPALQLYRKYCRTAKCHQLPESAEQSAKEPPIAIQWGMPLASRQARVADIAHCYKPDSFWREAGKQFLTAVFWRFKDNERQTCPYHLTLSASDLEANRPQDRALLRELLKDRLVLVGAQITSAGDLAVSPVHGKIPGVYVHAMALDNLINWGLEYDREPSSVGSTQIDWLDLTELALVGLIVLFKALHRRQVKRPKPDPQTCGQRWSRLLFQPAWPSWVFVVAVLGALTLLLEAQHITPVNILGILLISFVLFSDQFEQFFEQKD